VTYNLPKYKGSSLGWTDEDCVPLCRAYLEVSEDPVTEDGESGSTSSPSTRNKGYQRRPGGIKAAKLMRSEDASMEKQVKTSTAAVDELTVAQQERTALCFFDSPAMRHTPEATKYRQAVLRKMMQSVGLAAAPAPAPPPEPPTSRAVVEINIVEVDDGVPDMDVTPPAADASSSPPPAAGSAAGANAPPEEDPPAAPVAADNDGATALAAEAASPAAPPARGNGGGDNQRGRESQAAMQWAASAALSKKLDTTRGLDHSSESDTTTTTTEDIE